MPLRPHPDNKNVENLLFGKEKKLSRILHFIKTYVTSLKRLSRNSKTVLWGHYDTEAGIDAETVEVRSGRPSGSKMSTIALDSGRVGLLSR